MRSISHQRFKRDYGRNLRLGVAGALVLVLGLFSLCPPRPVASRPLAPQARFELVVLEALEAPTLPDLVEAERAPVTVLSETVFDVVDEPKRDAERWLPPASAPATLSDPSVDSFDVAPRASHLVRPDSPASARRSGIEGRVLLRVHVDRRGVVRNARILRSSSPHFVEPTLEAVYDWRFTPARKDGRAVPASILLPLEFRLV